MSRRNFQETVDLINLIPFLLSNRERPLEWLLSTLQMDRRELSHKLLQISQVAYGGLAEGDLLDLGFEDDELIVFTGGKFARPLQFTHMEMLAMQTGKLLSTDFGLPVADSTLESALQKLSEDLDTDDNAIPAPAIRSDRILLDDLLRPLQQAIEEKRCLTIQYYSHHLDRKTVRTIRPLSLDRCYGFWYAQALDTGLMKLRTFRLDRILELSLSRKRVSDRDMEHLEPEKPCRFHLTEPEQMARVLLDAEIARQVEESFPGGLNRNDGSLEIEIPMYNPNFIISSLLPWLEQVEILAPAFLRERMIRVLQDLQNLYQ